MITTNKTKEGKKLHNVASGGAEIGTINHSEYSDDEKKDSEIGSYNNGG